MSSVFLIIVNTEKHNSHLKKNKKQFVQEPHMSDHDLETDVDYQNFHVPMCNSCMKLLLS